MKSTIYVTMCGTSGKMSGYIFDDSGNGNYRKRTDNRITICCRCHSIVFQWYVDKLGSKKECIKRFKKYHKLI